MTQPLSDGELLARYAKENSQAAFSELARRHQGLVWGVCRRMLSNAQEAEDAARAVFWVLSRKAQSLSHRTSIAGWLYRTAQFVASRELRARRRREAREKEAYRMAPRTGDEPDRAMLR